MSHWDAIDYTGDTIGWVIAGDAETALRIARQKFGTIVVKVAKWIIDE